MPEYNFKCKRCGQKYPGMYVDHYLNYGEELQHAKCSCGGKLKKVLSDPVARTPKVWAGYKLEDM